MGTDVDSRQTHQQQHDADEPRQPSRLGAKGQQQQHDGDADMATGEGSRRPLTSSVSMEHKLVEPAVLVAGHRHHLIVGKEVVTHIGEDTGSNVVEAGSKIVVLRTGYG